MARGMSSSIPSSLHHSMLFSLQANVMLEYPISEAVELLQRNLVTAKKSLQQVEDDLDFLKDQCTTLEVGILI